MTKGSRNYDKELKRVEESFVEDVLARSDSEIMAEAAEDGNASTVLAQARDLVRRALEKSGKAKMMAARAAVNRTARKPAAAIIALPLSRKKEILRRSVEKSSALPQQITLAARNEDEMSESDLDVILENLQDLGVIDEQGNPQ
jgi:hypothetical protein